jgi:solute carrier family 35, member C2
VMEKLTPVMTVSVLFVSMFWEQLWVVLPSSPYFNSVHHLMITAALIFAGALIAFLMVWAEFLVIQETSALTFIIAGTLKEVVTGNGVLCHSVSLASCLGCQFTLLHVL